MNPQGSGREEGEKRWGRENSFPRACSDSKQHSWKAQARCSWSTRDCRSLETVIRAAKEHPFWKVLLGWRAYRPPIDFCSPLVLESRGRAGDLKGTRQRVCVCVCSCSHVLKQNQTRKKEWALEILNKGYSLWSPILLESCLPCCTASCSPHPLHCGFPGHEVQWLGALALYAEMGLAASSSA